MHVVDTSLLAEPGEEVSYADLQGRAADMQSTLLGFYGEPDGERDTYVALNLNPQGGETKREKRVWNKVGTSGGRHVPRPGRRQGPPPRHHQNRPINEVTGRAVA